MNKKVEVMHMTCVCVQRKSFKSQDLLLVLLTVVTNPSAPRNEVEVCMMLDHPSLVRN